MRYPEFVQEKETHIFRGFEIQTDQQISTRCAAQVIVNKNKSGTAE